jgi:carbon storage regulator
MKNMRPCGVYVLPIPKYTTIYDSQEFLMLVLSRQRDESIIIGDNVVVTVVDVRGDKVKLGITAPREVSVHRQEVYEAIQRENAQATKLDPKEVQSLGQQTPRPRRQ